MNQINVLNEFRYFINEQLNAGLNFVGSRAGLPLGNAEDYMADYTIVVCAPIPKNHTLFLRGASTDGTKAYVRSGNKIGQEITWDYPGVPIESKSVKVFCSHKFEYKFLLDDRQWEVNNNRTINFNNDFKDNGNFAHEIKF